MKICATSDLHGTLPEIDECDVLCICGDIVPTDIQRNILASEEWFKNEFFEWVLNIKCEKVIFVGGNHDFFLPDQYNHILSLISVNNLASKLIYLQDTSYTFNGIKFYGCPWVKGPSGWAFYLPNVEDKYNAIDDEVDVLLTHQPPRIGKLGCSYPNLPREREFGSDRLREAIASKKIRYNFCGHIHSGDHNKVLYPTTNVDTEFYNVSLKDEAYLPTYEPLYINIEPIKQ